MKTNLFKTDNKVLNTEVFEELFNFQEIKIERIISPFMPTGSNIWYDQPSDEIVFLIRGNATIEFEDETVSNLSEGDFLHIAAHVKHRVAYASKSPNCIWLALHINQTK